VLFVGLVSTLTGLAAPNAAAQDLPGLTAVPELARAYDAIFNVQLDEVPRLLAEACGPAPGEACQLLDAIALWWRIQLDPLNRSRDAEFRTRVDAAIVASEAWAEREPGRAEAWFYLGAAYGARVQWRVLRGERLSAAFDGRRVKDALERALELDPGMDDAYFGIGLYHYYADVAPAAARMLRWLLFLPGGDRERGLEEMRRARAGGQLVRSEADYQLHLIDIWYEQQPLHALELLAGLRDRHPANPHFVQATAEIEDVYLHDPAASLRTWQALLEAALDRRVAEPAMAETAARLGMARQLERLSDTEQAIEQLRTVIEAKPAAPFGAYADAQRRLARLVDR
jgi:tetratricopeptide (TPR) repeat protein